MDHGVNFRSLAFPIPVVQRFPFAAYNQQQQKQHQQQQQLESKTASHKQVSAQQSSLLSSGFIRKKAKPYIDFQKVDTLVDPNCPCIVKTTTITPTDTSASSSADNLPHPVESLKMRPRSSEARSADTSTQYSYRDTSTSTKSRMVETNPGCPDACYHQNRPEEFYDLFLASSVLKSDEYKELVEERKRKRKSEEQVVSYLGDEEIQRTIDNYNNNISGGSSTITSTAPCNFRSAKAGGSQRGVNNNTAPQCLSQNNNSHNSSLASMAMARSRSARLEKGHGSSKSVFSQVDLMEKQDFAESQQQIKQHQQQQQQQKLSAEGQMNKADSEMRQTQVNQPKM